MKKLLIYLGAVALGVVLTFPLLCGFALQKAYDVRTTNLPQRPGITFEVEPLQRGWFKSQASVGIKLELDKVLGSAEFAGRTLQLVVQSDLFHGPLVWTDHGLQLGLGYGAVSFSSVAAEGTSSELAEWLQQAPLSIHTLIDFQQAASTTLTVQPYSSTEGDESLEFGGASVTLASNRAFDHFEGSLQFGGLQLNQPDVQVNMPSASGSMEYEGNDPYTMVGESVFNIPRVEISGGKTSVVLQNINLNGGNQLNQGLMSYFQTMEIGQIESPLPLKSAIWHLEFNGIAPAALEAWADYSMKLQEQIELGTVQTTAAGGVDLTPEMEAQLRAVLKQLLQPGLGFFQRLDLVALDAPQQASLKLEYVGLPGVDIDQVQDPLQFLPAFSGELSIKLDEASIMASPFGQLLLPYMQQGLLMSEQDKLVLLAILKDGNLMLNGSPLPLQAMLESMLNPQPATQPVSQPQP